MVIFYLLNKKHFMVMITEKETIARILRGRGILKKDGTIEMADHRGTRFAAREWKNLVYAECKFFGVVGITRNGEIMSLNSDK